MKRRRTRRKDWLDPRYGPIWSLATALLVLLLDKLF
jgi:hypothetical protein